MEKINKNILTAASIYGLILLTILGVIAYALLNKSSKDPHKTIVTDSEIHDPSTATNSKTHIAEDENMKATIKLGNDSICINNSTAYLLVSLKGKKINPIATSWRQPLNLSIIIDRSGSMQGEKLDNVKKALIDVSDLLSPGDFVSLIAYDDHERLVYSGDFNKENFISKVGQVTDGGGTNIEGGLRMGIDQLLEAHKLEKTRNFQSAHISRVLLLSDGQANVGISTPDGLANMVKGILPNDAQLATIGVGSDYNENLMTQVAIAGNGNYYYMRSPEEADEIFTKEFLNYTNVSAKNIKVEFGLSEIYKVERGIGYTLNNKSYFNPKDISVDKEVSYLFEIKPSNIPGLIDTNPGENFANINIEFSDPQTNQKHIMNIPVEVTHTTDKVNPLSDNEVYKEYMKSYRAEKMWEVDDKLNKVQNEEARKIIDDVIVNYNEASKRLPGEFDKDIAALKSKQDYLNSQGNSDIQYSPAGRDFKKLNQSESFDLQYNK
jgi:Ca-activated chloride channel family protein